MKKLANVTHGRFYRAKLDYANRLQPAVVFHRQPRRGSLSFELKGILFRQDGPAAYPSTETDGIGGASLAGEAVRVEFGVALSRHSEGHRMR